MTEAEWLTCKNSDKMLVAFPPQTERKAQLFASACCRLIGHLLTDRGLRAITGIERALDGKIPLTELFELSPPTAASFATNHEGDSAVRSAFSAGGRDGLHYCRRAANYSAAASTDAPAVWNAQAELVRDIVGNPFRPVTFAPEWRTDTAVAIARTMYESREFGAMPILADALQDAGCDNDDILNHCRDANATHVRGCWVVDLVLGKE